MNPPCCFLKGCLADPLSHRGTRPVLQEACEGLEAATQLLSLLCERVLRSQPALGVADRAALLAAGPRFRREAAAALVAAQPGGHSWAGALRA